MSTSTKIVMQLIDYLSYRRECGQKRIEIEPQTRRLLLELSRGGAPHRPATPVTKAAVQAPVSVPRPGTNEPPEDVLARTAAAIEGCKRCGLHAGRQKVVPGQGNCHRPDVMFIGEAPGADEDRQGLAFVGRAGQLLTKMIAAMGYRREEVFIANICKCRPPGNRAPTPEEMKACLPFLEEQISVIRPRTIVAMGNVAVTGLLGISGITRLRGQWTQFAGIPLLPIFHPAYLLRFPQTKRLAWDDLKKVLRKLGKPIPKPAKTAPSNPQR